jgi:hypothetical protein
MALTLGDVNGVPGEIVHGLHPLIELATAPGAGAGLEELAVVIITAADVSEGDPRVLISANIHGPEICPTIVAHRVIESVEAAYVQPPLLRCQLRQLTLSAARRGCQLVLSA